MAVVSTFLCPYFRGVALSLSSPFSSSLSAQSIGLTSGSIVK